MAAALHACQVLLVLAGLTQTTQAQFENKHSPAGRGNGLQCLQPLNQCRISPLAKQRWRNESLAQNRYLVKQPSGP